MIRKIVASNQTGMLPDTYQAPQELLLESILVIKEAIDTQKISKASPLGSPVFKFQVKQRAIKICFNRKSF